MTRSVKRPRPATASPLRVYTFRLDGPALAAYFRDQAEEMLRGRGELPLGTALETPAYYRDMTGDGELWIGSNGLPLRQILRMHFPEQRDEIVQAEIVTDFSDFGEAAGGVTTAGPLARIRSLATGLLLRLPGLGGMLGLLALAAAALFVLHRRGRLFQGLSVALVFMLVVQPLLSQMQTAAALATLTERAAAQEQQQVESRQVEALQASLDRPQFDAHADPLQAAPVAAPSGSDPSGDDDKDGLTNFEEESAGADPTYWDTDEDGISDLIEVTGFGLGDMQWFMNPIEEDSNDDGLPDTTEYDFNHDGDPDDTDR